MFKMPLDPSQQFRVGLGERPVLKVCHVTADFTARNASQVAIVRCRKLPDCDAQQDYRCSSDRLYRGYAAALSLQTLYHARDLTRRARHPVVRIEFVVFAHRSQPVAANNRSPVEVSRVESISI